MKSLFWKVLPFFDFYSLANGQKKTIRGTIPDSDGLALPGSHIGRKSNMLGGFPFSLENEVSIARASLRFIKPKTKLNYFFKTTIFHQYHDFKKAKTRMEKKGKENLPSETYPRANKHSPI